MIRRWRAFGLPFTRLWTRAEPIPFFFGTKTQTLCLLLLHHRTGIVMSRRMIKLSRTVVLLAATLMFAQAASGYSVLSHQAIID